MLDAGCGEGETLARLGSGLPEHVAAIDVSADAVSFTAQRFPSVEVSRQSLVDLPFADGSFDLVVCLEVLEHLSDPDSALAELARVASGHVIVSVPHEPWFRLGSLLRGKYARAPSETTRSTSTTGIPRTLRRLLEGRLEVVSLRRSFPWLIAGLPGLGNRGRRVDPYRPLDPGRTGDREPLTLATGQDHHLGQQAEGEQLHPDDDQEDGEEKKWAPADATPPAELEDGQVDADPDPHSRSSAMPDAAEEVKGPVLVAADEDDGEQVERAAQVALGAEAGTAVAAGTVIDGHLRHPPALLGRDRRQEAMQLAVDLQRARALAAVGLEAAIHVVHGDTGEPSGRPVEDARGQAPRPGIAARPLPAADQVRASSSPSSSAGISAGSS